MAYQLPENLFAVPTCGPYGRLHAFLIFSFNQEILLTAQFFMQHLINIPNFIRFSCKCMGSTVYGIPSLPILHRNVCQETSACPSPHDIHFFVNIGKFGVSYFYDFAKHSQEMSHIYYLEYCQLINTCLKLGSVFCFYFYYKKCEKNCWNFATLSKWSTG